MAGQFSGTIAKAKSETDMLKKALRKKKEDLADTTCKPRCYAFVEFYL